MSDEPVEGLSLNVEVGPLGVRLYIATLPFAPLMTPEVALGIAERLKEAVALYDKHYRAFVHLNGAVH